jgi:uncharacterized paraquat-inducible protein A
MMRDERWRTEWSYVYGEWIRHEDMGLVTELVIQLDLHSAWSSIRPETSLQEQEGMRLRREQRYLRGAEAGRYARSAVEAYERRLAKLSWAQPGTKDTTPT